MTLYFDEHIKEEKQGNNKKDSKKAVQYQKLKQKTHNNIIFMDTTPGVDLKPHSSLCQK